MNEYTKIKNNMFEDLHSYRDIQAKRWGLRFLKAATSGFKLFGLKNEEIDKSIKNAEATFFILEKEMKKIDKFNDFLSDHGWVAYESMNSKVMCTAVILAEKGDFEQVDDFLSYHFDQQSIDSFLGITLKRFKEYRIRWHMAQAAKEDYLAERYYSCVPLILMLIDGFVSDFSGEKGFFAEKTEINAWDSIAGHSSGLNSLKKILFSRRQKTTDEAITIPYRNGIMHGIDLGYANKIVAAKCWSTLFAIGDWAKAVEEEAQKRAEINKKPPSLKDSLKQLAETEKSRKKSENWIPRDISINDDGSEPTDNFQCEIDSPEEAVVSFLEAWKSKNYGKAAKYLDDSQKKSIGYLAGLLKKQLEKKETKILVDYKILKIKDEALVVSEIQVRLFVNNGEEIIERVQDFRMIRENSEGKPVHRNENGDWYIVFTTSNEIIYGVWHWESFT